MDWEWVGRNRNGTRTEIHMLRIRTNRTSEILIRTKSIAGFLGVDYDVNDATGECSAGNSGVGVSCQWIPSLDTASRDFAIKICSNWVPRLHNRSRIYESLRDGWGSGGDGCMSDNWTAGVVRGIWLTATQLSNRSCVSGNNWFSWVDRCKGDDRATRVVGGIRLIARSWSRNRSRWDRRDRSWAVSRNTTISY